MSRIEPLTEPFESRVAAQLARMMPRGAEPIALFRLFARNPPMTQAMFGWGGYELGRQLSLALREREIVIDRTCARTGCEYEWGVHVQVFGARAGLDEAQIRSLTHGNADDACWSEPRERLLIRAADSLYEHRDIDDALWTRLRNAFGEPQLLDLIMLCGWYQAISTCARTTRIANEPGAPTFASVA